MTYIFIAASLTIDTRQAWGEGGDGMGRTEKSWFNSFANRILQNQSMDFVRWVNIVQTISCSLSAAVNLYFVLTSIGLAQISSFIACHPPSPARNVLCVNNLWLCRCQHISLYNTLFDGTYPSDENCLKNYFGKLFMGCVLVGWSSALGLRDDEDMYIKSSRRLSCLK